MSIELWLAFVLASVAVLASPGPATLLVFSFGLEHGRSSAWATVPGCILGDFIAMTLSLAGAGAILTASSSLFSVLKLIGAAYLIWLGFKIWRRAPLTLDEIQTRGAADRRTMFWQSFAITALHPGGFVFFIAFVPQFVDPTSPALPQFAILEATFLVLAAANVFVWASFAAMLRTRARDARLFRWANRIGGTFLAGAGLAMAMSRRSA